MGFFSRWLKKSPVSVAQKFSESPVNISQVTQLPIDWFGPGGYERRAGRHRPYRAEYRQHAVQGLHAPA